MKKGQLFGQPFMYIFYATVAILILFFGIRMALNISEQGGLVTEGVFFGDVEDKFDSVHRDAFGSSISLKDLKIPTDIVEFCFVDLSKTKDLDEVFSPKLADFIDISYESGSVDNVFVIDGNNEVNSVEIKRDFILYDFALCDLLTDRELDIRLVNEGSFIRAQHI